MPCSAVMRRMFALFFSVLAAVGCASTDSPEGGSGSLSLNLVLAEGIEIDEVAWAITGNDTDKSGSIDTSAPGSTASVEVYGLLPNGGEGDEPYVVALSAVSVDGKVTCAGSTPFDVEVGVSTEVMVILNCKLPQQYGGVRVNGKFNVCAQVNMAMASPLQTSVGNEIDLSAMAVDEEGDPITYMWSSESGMIANPMAAATTYTCTEVGSDVITILVTDDDGTYCMDMHSIPVTCVAGEGNPCDDVVCDDDGNECTAEECDPSTGLCASTPVDDGTDCDGGAGMCTGGECVAKDRCMDVTCEDDGNECTSELCNPDTGECETSNVDDGTACGDGGACMGGTCIEADPCDEITCDDTGNECTVNVCNSQTGVCDEMNAPDGTDCNGGAGSCSAGECVDNSLCDNVPCTSSNECVQDGTCDPANGECIAGDNEPINTGCTTGGSFCDGQGNCVECNSAGQCPDDGNECTAAACDGNQCGQNAVMDGMACDFDGSAGVCESGACMAAPECLSPGDCNDGNPCTAGDCVDGMCSFTPVDGGTCEVEPGVPGICGGGACVGLCDGEQCPSASQCVDDGTCDPANGSCIAGDPKAADEPCSENGGTVCDGSGNCVECNTDGQCGDGVCVDGSCQTVAVACGAQTKVVSVGCTNNVTEAQSPFPFELSVDVPTAILANSAFTAGLDGVGFFPEFFLDAAQGVVCGGLRQAQLVDFVSTVQVRSGATGADVPLGIDLTTLNPGSVRFCNFPFDQTCTVNGDCLGGVCNAPIILQDLPVLDGIPLSPGGCDADTSNCPTPGPPTDCDCSACDALGGAKAAQCSDNGFCQNGSLVLQMQASSGSYTAGDSGGQVLFGWSDGQGAGTTPVPGLSICPVGSECGTVAGRVDGCYQLPVASFANPVPPIGIRVNAGGLAVPIQCAQAEDGGSCSTTATQGCLSDADCPGVETCIGVGEDDDVVCPTPDASLISCPIN